MKMLILGAGTVGSSVASALAGEALDRLTNPYIAILRLRSVFGQPSARVCTLSRTAA